MADAINKGYLLENFRLFHLRDRRAQKMAPHYHEFDKIVVLCAGAVDYTVEGVSYRMQPPSRHPPPGDLAGERL